MNKENKKTHFIKTQDLAAAEGLKKAGFQLLDYQNDTWVFLNSDKCTITFEDMADMNVVFSDILHI